MVAGGQVVHAEHAAQAEQSAAPEGPREREDQIRIVPGDAVVEADPEAEGAQHAESAHASIDRAAARAHVALARDADGGDRRRERLEQADVERCGHGGVVAARRPVGTHREAAVGNEAGRLPHGFDLAALVRRESVLLRGAGRSCQDDREK